jgi:mono/diheme cytochrome c family protein
MLCWHDARAMKPFGRLLLLLLATAVLTCAAEHPLRWDAVEKRAEPKLEDGVVHFEFHVTNTSDRPVVVRDVRASCGCTTLTAPPRPWTLPPGGKGTVRASVDFLGKEGEIAKQVYVATVEGTQTLTMVIKVPPVDPAARARNQQLAAANRQAVFQGQCAACHAAPAESRYGIDLFEAVCAICHDSKHRAAMVPDLAMAKETRDAAWWQKWIVEGRDGSLMPAFAQAKGGPLSPAQVDSLVEYLLEKFPPEPRRP